MKGRLTNSGTPFFLYVIIFIFLACNDKRISRVAQETSTVQYPTIRRDESIAIIIMAR